MIAYEYSIFDLDNINDNPVYDNYKFDDDDKTIIESIEDYINKKINLEREVSLTDPFDDYTTDVTRDGLTFSISPVSFYTRDLPTLEVTVQSIEDSNGEDIFEDEWGNYKSASEVSNVSDMFYVTPYRRMITITGTDYRDDVIEILRDNLINA